MPTRREREGIKDSTLKKKGYKLKPWQRGRQIQEQRGRQIQEQRESKRKSVFKSDREKEEARREIERMGLDCIIGIELMERGVPLRDLLILARGDANTFLGMHGKKLDRKHWRYIRQKYK